MRIPRPAVVAVVAVATVALGAFVTETVHASRIEADLSTRIGGPATPGSAPPSVMIGGGPGSRWVGPDTLASAAIRIEGVERPGLGPVAVEARATDVLVPDDPAAPPIAGESTVSVQITGDSLGPALGMRDVLVGAADDPSLAGGTEHRARVTGTLEGSDVRVSAFVDLVVDTHGARLVPVAPATGPAGFPDGDGELALRRTALTLEPDVLPLGATVDTLTVTGGTITAAGVAARGGAPLDGLARPGH
ncbi:MULTISPECIES: DUF2993 domain-containing protein [Dietzia]|uniref:DUF2993 domain-containing protein n=1 Tax=Dietzia cinnamea TaxID=321318 RepID=A0A4R3ZRA0_9ACTN|nr:MULTISPECIES: DUF2993 domain-containing protein [Dietzia]KZO60553.1 hypothetical protein A2U19_00955 [Dietzia maris]MBM7229770.1 DUF2993 domain-containing protein [Dietzia cinnamea]MCT1885889.1 DUF2993 domain-containing protein [Dietzia cinnamea]MCT2059244.1 DUF2993 domain-containing protein [Dietzia cinnamea]MCT2062427.1 DUF2993 domain-containing protein [Dietzia cinnamea]